MPAYTPLGTNNVVADFWLAAQVIDYWFEIEAARIPPPAQGGPYPGPDAIEPPTRKLVLELGPTLASPMIVAGAPGFAGVTGRKTRIAFKDLPDPFAEGQLPHLDLTGATDTYDCTLPTAMLDFYLQMLKSGRPCYVQSDIEDPRPPAGGGPGPIDVAVLKSYLSNR